MSAPDPLVCIIIPSHNREALLPEALNSALEQDYPYKKVLVIDDGSTDGTRQVALGYAQRHPDCVSYQYKPNGGCASARNAGLDWVDASIDYVAFLDSDDRLLPGKLSREVQLLRDNPDADFTYSNSVIYTEDTGHEEHRPAAAAGRPDDFALELFLSNEAKSGAILYRARAVRSRRFREDLRYNEDSEFLQRVAIECRGIYCSEPGCWVRWHSGSKSRNTVEILKAVLRSSMSILQDYPDFHRRHASMLNRRIERIRKELFMELMINERWHEAAAYAGGSIERLSAARRVNAMFRLERFALGALRQLRASRRSRSR